LSLKELEAEITKLNLKERAALAKSIMCVFGAIIHEHEQLSLIRPG